jgi:hypothetical protein
MGKKKYTQDKLWIIMKEMVEDWGVKRRRIKNKPSPKTPILLLFFKFTPFHDPYA